MINVREGIQPNVVYYNAVVFCFCFFLFITECPSIIVHCDVASRLLGHPSILDRICKLL